MRNTVQERLEQLRAEFENGQKLLGDLDRRRAELQTTMLRIEGAIQVLQEVLAQENPPGQ